jgi:hypothetical protein
LRGANSESSSSASSQLDGERDEAQGVLTAGLAAATLDEIGDQLRELTLERDRLQLELVAARGAHEPERQAWLQHALEMTLGLVGEVLYADRQIATTLYGEIGKGGSQLLGSAVILSIGTTARLCILVWLATYFADRVAWPCGMCPSR